MASVLEKVLEHKLLLRRGVEGVVSKGRLLGTQTIESLSNRSLWSRLVRRVLLRTDYVYMASEFGAMLVAACSNNPSSVDGWSFEKIAAPV